MSSDSRERSSRILTIPNILTAIRLGCIPLILLFIWERDLRYALFLLLVAGVTDFLDGLTARLLKQKTLLGMYLDPIADKLLLSSCFLVLALTGEVSWVVSGMVLARDAGIVITAAVLMFTTQLRRFPPTLLGKANTAVQVAAVFAVLLDVVSARNWVHLMRLVLLFLTPVLVMASSAHYAFLTLRKLRRRRKNRAEASARSPSP